jgi:hypothetical protein
MQLKDFIAQSLSQIIEGIMEAKQLSKGGKISPGVFPMGEDHKWFRTQKGVHDWVEFVEFDVAVTVTEGEKDKSNANIGVMSVIRGGIAKEYEDSNSHVTKIKFRIPVVWPDNE